MCLAVSGQLTAHPLGNNTVNRQAAFLVAPGRLSLDYRMDLAEIPTLAAEARADADGDGAVDDAEWHGYARQWAEEVRAALHLTVDGRALRLRVARAEPALRDGEAGLKVLQLHVRLHGVLPQAFSRLAYRDDFHPREPGWKEIWMRGTAGVVLDGAVAREDRSRALSAYPADAVPLDELQTEVSVRLPAAAPGTRTSGPEGRQAQSRSPAPDVTTSEAATGLEPAEAPPSTAVAPAPTPGAPGVPRPRVDLLGMFRLGFHHILTGFDHLAFLAGLLLLAPRLGSAVRVVTAFTLAHSLTLYLAATGHVAAPPALVEPAIALTVAWVGGLALRGKGGEHGALLAFGFGLIHGLGFAGALAEALGANATSLLPLLCFNLGIEACQIVLVAIALLLVAALRRGRWARFGAPVRRAVSLAVLASGLAWFLARV